MKIAQIIIASPTLNILDYLIPDDMILLPGSIIKAPFRSKFILGIVFKVTNETLVPINKLKYIKEHLNLPPFKPDLITFITKISFYYSESYGNILKLFLPNFSYKLTNNIKEKKTYKFNLATLSLEQEKAQKFLINSINKNKFNVTYLDGVTGSGKTEVYFSIVASILEKEPDAQILILLPEIVLASQLISRFEQRLGFKPACFHSESTSKSKKEIWQNTLLGYEQVIIGARSSLFLPFKNLKLIIIDEEHEATFKQEDGVCYNGRDMAILKAYIENISVILSSATPSIETYYNVINNKYNHVILKNRFNEASMPEVKIVDLKTNRSNKNQYISDTLKKNMIDTLADGKQILLFLNRRGYAPLTLCKKCGYRYICPRCTTWLVEHKSKNKLECHHCGFYQYTPKNCQNCDTENSLEACGPGVERIDEEVRTIFPNSHVALMTKDTNHQDTQELIKKIENNEIDIIIGTQIIAKGLHFPQINLVGIIDADIGLMGGDLRACEKTYQLLSQVSGRAGRESKNSKVIIQTYFPENSTIVSMTQNSRDSFLENELETRKAANMPPFSRLASIIISGTDEEKLTNFAKNMVKIAPINKHILLLGPARAFIYKLKDRYRMRFLIKTEKNIKIQGFIEHWLALVKKPNNIRIKIDIDPYSFF